MSEAARPSFARAAATGVALGLIVFLKRILITAGARDAAARNARIDEQGRATDPKRNKPRVILAAIGVVTKANSVRGNGNGQKIVVLVVVAPAAIALSVQRVAFALNVFAGLNGLNDAQRIRLRAAVGGGAAGKAERGYGGSGNKSACHSAYRAQLFYSAPPNTVRRRPRRHAALKRTRLQVDRRRRSGRRIRPPSGRCFIGVGSNDGDRN